MHKSEVCHFKNRPTAVQYTDPEMFYIEFPILTCFHSAFTVRLLALSTLLHSAPFALTVHKALTVCSQSVHQSLSVHL